MGLDSFNPVCDLFGIDDGAALFCQMENVGCRRLACGGSNGTIDYFIRIVDDTGLTTGKVSVRGTIYRHLDIDITWTGQIVSKPERVTGLGYRKGKIITSLGHLADLTSSPGTVNQPGLLHHLFDFSQSIGDFTHPTSVLCPREKK